METITSTMLVLDKRTNKKETLIEATVSSFNITQTKPTKEGINCTQWFTEESFNKFFKFLD